MTIPMPERVLDFHHFLITAMKMDMFALFATAIFSHLQLHSATATAEGIALLGGRQSFVRLNVCGCHVLTP
jgi:hypothetical protein